MVLNKDKRIQTSPDHSRGRFCSKPYIHYRYGGLFMHVRVLYTNNNHTHTSS
jgi:hypothetical protein